MFKKVLVPVDIQRPGLAGQILKTVNQMVAGSDSQVHVLTVMPGYGMPIVATYFPADAKKTVKQELEVKLSALVEKHLDRPATTSVVEGKRAEEILKVAKRRKVDLILIGSQSRGKLDDAFLGSCGTKVAQRADCSVLVIR